MARIGMTTTVPVEVILAAGHVPVDLNNVFITGSEPMRQVEAAEVVPAVIAGEPGGAAIFHERAEAVGFMGSLREEMADAQPRRDTVILGQPVE